MLLAVAVSFLPTTLLKAQTTERPYCGKIISYLPEQVLKIEGKIYTGAQSRGSFSIVDKFNILTNEHNVRDHLEEKGLGHMTRVELIFFNGETREGVVLDIHKPHDLAIVGVVGGIPDGAHRIKFAETHEDAIRLTVAGYEGGETYVEKVTDIMEEDVRFDYAFRFRGIYKQGMSGSPVINERGEQCGILFGSDYPANPSHGYATTAEHILEFLEKNNLTH